MINTDTSAPTAHPSLVYDAPLEPTLRGIIINAPGDLFVRDITGTLVHLTYAAFDPSATGPSASSDFPAKLDLQIREIVGNGSGSAGDGSTGTDIALADLVGLL